MKMKKHLIHADSLNHVRHKHGRWTSQFGSFSQNYTSERVNICARHLKLRDHDRMFCSATQFSYLISTVLASTENNIFKDIKDNEQKHDEAMFDQKKQCSVYMGDLWNLNRNFERIIPHHDGMDEHAVHFWRRRSDASRMHPKMNTHIQEPYDRDFPSITNVTVEVPKLLYVESFFDT